MIRALAWPYLATCCSYVGDGIACWAVKCMIVHLQRTCMCACTSTYTKSHSQLLCLISDELEQFETDCDELFSHFQHRNVDALVASVKSTLDALRRRITTSSSGRGSSRVYPTSISSYTEESTSRPCSCFMAELVLSLPNIIIQPSLEEIQNTVNQAVQMVSEIGQKIPLWTHPNPSSNQSTPKAGATQSQSKLNNTSLMY